MILALHITFRNLRHSTALENLICEQAARLDRFYDRIQVAVLWSRFRNVVTGRTGSIKSELPLEFRGTKSS